jgi:hypothetical protein
MATSLRVQFVRTVQTADRYATILAGTPGTVQGRTDGGLINVIAQVAITNAGTQGDTSCACDPDDLMVLPGSLPSSGT